MHTPWLSYHILTSRPWSQNNVYNFGIFHGVPIISGLTVFSRSLRISLSVVRISLIPKKIILDSENSPWVLQCCRKWMYSGLPFIGSQWDMKLGSIRRLSQLSGVSILIHACICVPKVESINRLTQLSVSQLTGVHCISPSLDWRQ